MRIYQITPSPSWPGTSDRIKAEDLADARRRVINSKEYFDYMMKHSITIGILDPDTGRYWCSGNLYITRRMEYAWVPFSDRDVEVRKVSPRTGKLIGMMPERDRQPIYPMPKRRS